jgi:hypothetical protein
MLSGLGMVVDLALSALIVVLVAAQEVAWPAN